MKAFISYSHANSAMLEMLHKHLAQLKRENIVTIWTDEEISAGSKVNATISNALSNSNLFIALLSPEYIASNYCYEKEFQTALEMEKAGNIIIVPVVAEPCDWLSTPFQDFKALPKDSKAVSTWENKNTAFLDIAQGIRKLLVASTGTATIKSKTVSAPIAPSRNYRIKKDFDTIQKLEFTEKTFHEIKELLKRYIEEIIQLDNINAKITTDTDQQFDCWLVNRNMINTEAQLKLSINATDNHPSFMRSSENRLSYFIVQGNQPSIKNFMLLFDEFEMYWAEGNYYSGSARTKLDAKGIAEVIWNEWLQSVGIL